MAKIERSSTRGVAQWDSSGARTNAIYPPSVQVGSSVRPTEGGWVGGWNEGCFLDEKKGRLQKEGQITRGRGEGEAKRRFFKNKDLAVSMSLIDFIQS